MSFSFDDILDRDVSELPRNVARDILPDGEYVVTLINVERKKVGDNDSVIFKYQLAEVLTVANPDKGVPELGIKVEEMFTVSGDNAELGVARLTSHLADVHTGKLGAFFAEPPIGQNFKITAKTREWKDKKSGEMKLGWQTHSTKDVGGLQFLGG